MTKFVRKTIMFRSRLKKISTKRRLMKIGIIIRSKGVFVLNYSSRAKKILLVTLMSKAFLTVKDFGNPRKQQNSTRGKNKGKIMNNYFTNITTYLKLKSTKIDSKVNLESIINTFQNHKNVQRIKLADFHSISIYLS